MGSLPKSLPRPRLPGFLGGRSKPSRTSSRSKRRLPTWAVVRRRLILVGVLLVALLAAYVFWFRDSSFVAVEDVQIAGAEQAPDAAAALRAAADGQSTLHVDEGALREAVANDPLVRSIAVGTDFPHTLRIDVDVRAPVAYIGSENAVVAADGTILDHTGERPDGLPAIELEGGKPDSTSGGAVTGDALEVSRVLGAVPGELAGEVKGGAMTKEYGVTVDFGPGIELRFGDASGAALKWKAVAAVLADPKFEGAAYLDLSVPNRPVAGGIPEDAAASAEGATAVDPEVAVDPVEPTDPTVTADPATAVVP